MRKIMAIAVAIIAAGTWVLAQPAAADEGLYGHCHDGYVGGFAEHDFGAVEESVCATCAAGAHDDGGGCHSSIVWIYSCLGGVTAAHGSCPN